MFQIFLENLKRLSVFIIISQMILHFGVGKKYEKYLKLILSFMIVAQFVFSVASFFHSGTGLMDIMSKEKYYAQLKEYMVVLEEEYGRQQSVLEESLKQNSVFKENGKKGEPKSIIIEKIDIP